MALVTLTQGHLKQLELCPRRFQYTYLEHLTAPTDPAMLDRQQWGTRFHQVMQQRQLGLTVAPLLAQDPALEKAVQALVEAAPELFATQDSDGRTVDGRTVDGRTVETATAPFRQSEHRRSLAYKGYALTVIYDLLIMTSTQAQIVDWKTHLHPPGAAQLAQDWQTRL
ncbi:MAG TPA: PD-(D/E)XK nuclease family protein, partial [Leptolyngbyaceae cyanobacterium M65_K2018_010]|nr:PD-(D/E)XK nuclease family protein [Leptolyngbyaceae cyanobacterium M65_K2018_010]